jgi:hypothetical protein
MKDTVTYRMDGKVTIGTRRQLDGRYETDIRCDMDAIEQLRSIMDAYNETHGGPRTFVIINANVESNPLRSHQHAVDHFDAAMMAYTFGEPA